MIRQDQNDEPRRAMFQICNSNNLPRAQPLAAHPLCRATLDREVDADLSDGPDGKRMVSEVQLVRGADGGYIIGATLFSPGSASKPAPPLPVGIDGSDPGAIQLLLLQVRS